jgi:hypothetical protein
MLDTTFTNVDTILLFESVLSIATNNYPISMADLFKKLN